MHNKHPILKIIYQKISQDNFYIVLNKITILNIMTHEKVKKSLF